MPSTNHAKEGSGKPVTTPTEMLQSPTSQSSPVVDAQEAQQNPTPPGAEPRDALTRFQAQPTIQQPQDQVQAVNAIPRAAPRIAPHEMVRARAGLELIRYRWSTHFHGDQFSIEDWAARLVLAVVNAVMGLRTGTVTDIASVIRQIKETPTVVLFRNNDFRILVWVAQVRQRLIEVIRAMGGSEETILRGNPYP